LYAAKKMEKKKKDLPEFALYENVTPWKKENVVT
jgi:hypothetical protein